MYADFFGFTGIPFQLTPDNRFFFGSSGHSRAMSHLVYGLAQEEGFIVITGEVGAGKTMLVERLWSELDRNSYTLARINTTHVSGDDLLRLVAASFELENTGADKAALLGRLERKLRDEQTAGRRSVLIVDEAQGLSVHALEELRMLSNITDGGRALLQTLLLGQPQFRAMLASRDLDQLRQRVLAAYHLGPLGREETHQYIEYRLKIVGWIGRPHWEEAASDSVHRHSGGVPRRINRLCSRTLLRAALEPVPTITESIVESTACELREDLSDVERGDQQSPSGPAGKDLTYALQLRFDDLQDRVAALEHTIRRRERVMEKLNDALRGYGEFRS